MMLKSKKLSLLLMALLVSACSNTNNSESEINNSSSEESSSSFIDSDKQNPIYDGSDVLVSKIVTNDYGSHIQVNNEDFLFIGSQIRVDAFMNCDKFSYDQIETLFQEAKKLNVNCVQIPIEWAKMELDDNKFDYTYLHTMMSFANKYDLKIEFLWFGTNMCGDTHSFTVPNYILKDGKTYPKLDALRTGEYWNYYGIMWFLDFDNENLIERETRAVNKMMDYIYEFDSTHGAKKPVIGIQVLNEPDIFVRWRSVDKNVLSRLTNERISEEEGYNKICNSLNAIGKTVKNSKYKVYTRVNFATSTASDSLHSGNGIYNGNEVKDAPYFVKKIQELEGIDIVGDDAYTSSVKNIKGISSMFATKMNNNFSHIAENDGNYANTASLILASISQHGGYSIYDLITSPFFASNNSANIDQGIMQFADNTYTSFKYKNHYEETSSIIKGLKEVEHLVYNVNNTNFACFNIKNDYASKETSQVINTENVTINFNTTTGAIGFALDSGTHLDVYFTNDATISLSNANVKGIASGSYTNKEFIKNEDISISNTISLKKNTLYRIDFESLGKLTSTTWDNIGG